LAISNSGLSGKIMDFVTRISLSEFNWERKLFDWG